GSSGAPLDPDASGVSPGNSGVTWSSNGFTARTLRTLEGRRVPSVWGRQRPSELRSTTQLDLHHRLLLQLLVLLRGDLALVAELGELGDLVGGGIPGRPTLPLGHRGHHLLVLLGHLRPRDHVDQDPEERDDEDQQEPTGLRPSREVVASEEGGENTHAER